MRMLLPRLIRLGTLLLATALLHGCKSLPPSMEEVFTFKDSHKFQCHAVSPGPCSYVVFNESGSARETFTLKPGESRVVANVQPRTAFCLAVEKPLEPTKCQRFTLDGKPQQR